MSCKHCECQKCADERTYLEKKYIKIILTLSTENRSPEQIHNNLDKEIDNNQPSKHDIIYAQAQTGRTFSVKFNNIGGNRSGLLYRLSLWNAKKNLLSHIKMITNKKSIIVADLNEDLLDLIPNSNY